MMKKAAIGLVLVLTLGGAVAAMGGMSWLDSTGLRGQERLLNSRIDAYWDARKGGDIETMAAYIHPLQESVPEVGMLVTEAYELQDLSIDGDRAMSTVSVRSRLKHPIFSSRERTVELKTAWVRYHGKWYKDVTPSTITDAIKQYQGKWTPPTDPTVVAEQ